MTDNLSDNALIAEFMGATIYTDWGLYLENTYYKFKHPRPTADSPLTHEEIEFNRATEQLAIWNPKYDTSWDWLMPVVEKIRYANIEGSRRNELIDNINYALSCVDIGEVYKNAVKFIVHFNSKTKPV